MFAEALVIMNNLFSPNSTFTYGMIVIAAAEYRPPSFIPVTLSRFLTCRMFFSAPLLLTGVNGSQKQRTKIAK